MRTTPGTAVLLITLAAATLSACTAAAPADPVALSVRWGLGETSALPSDVAEVEILTCVTEDGVEVCDPTSCSVAALTLMRADGPVDICRPAEGTEAYEDDPVLVRRGLPIDQPLRFRLLGKDAGGALLYVGQTGTFVLGEGQRRYQEITMYPVGRAQLVPGAAAAVALHTATYLADGRVLVAGGFDTLSTLSACPAELALLAGTRCFDLRATDGALVFDVASGVVEPLRARMLAPRGGHTATELPDGRVLLAGGASRAVLAMIPQGAAAASGYRAELFPMDDEGMAGAHDHFEIFDAFAGNDSADEDRDGDLGRGGFLGIAGTSSPAPLNHPRFLHAAAAVATSPERVILAGGLGSAAGQSSYEVFDAERRGGFGVYRGGGALGVARGMPGAAALADGTVWIFGGGFAAGDADLADVWSAGDGADPNGATMPASAVGEFPHTAPAGTDAHPEYALFRPSVATLDSAQRALVVGWVGAQCAVGLDEPLFRGADETETCNAPTSPRTRSFTVSGATGLAAPTPARLHAYGAAARLFPFEASPSGTPVQGVAVTGGVANRLFTTQAAIDIFSGSVDSSGAAAQITMSGATLMAQRLFHTSTGVPGYGVVTFGGLAFPTAGLDRASLEADVEILFLSL